MPTSKASTSSTTRAKAVGLERIRNNQRRCRARRKEYIAQLEDKIRQYESTSVQSSTEPKLQQLVRENESLKKLLQSLGLGDAFLKAYIKATQIAPDIARSQLGDENCCQGKACSSSSLSLDNVEFNLVPIITRDLQAQDPPLSASTDVEAITQDHLQFFESPTPADAVMPWEPFDFSTFSTFSLGSLQTEIQPQRFVQPAGVSRIESFNSTMPAQDTSDLTTLCSLAFSLVLKNNLKGYSTADLDRKLRVGYRRGITPSEGCRVDNKILLNVLAEIS